MNAPKNPTKRHANPNNDDDNIITTPENATSDELSILMKLAVKYRKSFLFLAASLGLGLFFCMYYPPEVITYYLPEWSNFFKNFWEDKRLEPLTRNSLSLLVLGLPTFFLLWIFRTYDVRQQLEKTQKNIDKTEKSIKKTQESIDNSTFFECASLLANEEKEVSKKIALEQLIYLGQKNPSYKERIDSLTQGLPLEKANLSFAELDYINLSNANLRNAILTEVKLIKANLIDAKLIGTDLTDANLSGADLINANLSGADLINANLTGTDLTDAKLGANLTDANLTGADLTRANLTHAVDGINFTVMKFGADLHNTDLTSATLYGTNLEKAQNYDTAIFKGAKYDEDTKFPPDFDPEKAGCIKD